MAYFFFHVCYFILGVFHKVIHITYCDCIFITNCYILILNRMLCTRFVILRPWFSPVSWMVFLYSLCGKSHDTDIWISPLFVILLIAWFFISYFLNRNLDKQKDSKYAMKNKEPNVICQQQHLFIKECGAALSVL